VLLGLGLTVYPIVKVGEISAVSGLGAAGLAFLVLALASRRARSLAVGAVILIALHYALTLHAVHATLDAYSILFALGLYLMFEAADLSIAIEDLAPMTRPSASSRAITTFSIAATGGLLGLVTLLARSLFAGGVAGVPIGAICALGVMAIPLRSYFHRGTGQPRPSGGKSSGVVN
jgi:hypothetical protein